MFLKRLDIVGFKSFAERVSIDFVPGVTAVVGPNGSGKSNITDAIRWVLGEQSAKSLRGAKMEDIIFAGSDSRKPLNIGEVTLTLDNEDQFLPIDYHEVSVTRRVFRSGESEFLINKQQCRLKDIVDLFMDSGLGREAFSIISQGKVEEILSSKAEERRSIFEEAAGVLKYKTRKKKAEYKLAETQENLHRVSDIVHELEGQIEPLEIQSSIAKDYIEKKEDLEKIEVALTVFEVEDLHKKWEDLRSIFQQHKNDEIESSSSLQKLESEIEHHREQIIALDESIDDLQEVLLLASEELEKLEGRKEVLKERKKNASQNRTQLEKVIDEFEIKRHEHLAQRDEEAQLLKQYEEDVNVKQLDLKQKTQMFASYDQNIEDVIEGLKSDYIELLNKKAALNNELTNIEDQLKQQNVRKSHLEEVNEKYIIQRKETNDQKILLQTKISKVQEEINDQISTFRNKQTNLEQLKTKYQKKENLLYQAYQYLQQTKSRKEMLEEIKEDYSGFFHGVKEVLKARDKHLQGVEGAIAELIQVPQEYEIAIEIALGAATQHIVVHDEQNARQAISYLKKNSYGRATFLPLSVIKERKISDLQLNQIKNHPSYVGVASDLITFDEKYSAVLKNVLGTVVITTDLKGANDLARQLQFRYRLVTLEGDVVNPGGSMTGGAVKQKSNSLLSRGRELEELSVKVLDMEQKTSQLEAQVKELKDTIKEDEAGLEVLRETGNTLRLSEQSIKGEIRELEIEEKNVNDRLTVYDFEKENFSQQMDEMNARTRAIKEQVSVIENQVTNLDQEIEKLTLEKNDQQISKESLQKEITELKVELASQEQLLANHQEKAGRTLHAIAEIEDKLQEAKEDLSLLQNEMSSNSSGEEVLVSEAVKKKQDKSATVQLIAERRDQRLHLQQKLEDQEREAKEQKRQYKQLVEVLRDEEVKINRLDVELENRLTHLREEYMLTFEAAKERYPLELNIEEARQKVKLIKLSIDELGNVNLGAIDEFERVNERYSFLQEQKEDLLQAKDTLYQVIDEMDDEMKRRFQTTFNNISSHFEPVFQALFGGGRAELKLTDPGDLLNTGVEIIAQPPGKKPQNLSLLSGGERALTAIALLFAILKVRPVPFCVLDEVEAALDEANVHRFAQYLQRYSSDTQFIVITHRKGTMEEADVLYGVTMQESGVSKLVSVRLGETAELVK
ncbi:chromosome segregation protein SMC [Cytobacillus sp. Hm23]